MSEITGQCWGGPEHGNLVSASVSDFSYLRVSNMWLDGDGGEVRQMEIKGTYRWDKERCLFMWFGPGADGDTIERLRL